MCDDINAAVAVAAGECIVVVAAAAAVVAVADTTTRSDGTVERSGADDDEMLTIKSGIVSACPALVDCYCDCRECHSSIGESIDRSFVGTHSIESVGSCRQKRQQQLTINNDNRHACTQARTAK